MEFSCIYLTSSCKLSYKFIESWDHIISRAKTLAVLEQEPSLVNFYILSAQQEARHIVNPQQMLRE